MLKTFYSRFHPQIENGEKISRAEALQVRQLGVDPKSSKPIYVRFGRYGPVLQLGESPDPKDKSAAKPQFAPLPENTTIETVNLDQALPMFSLPRIVGQTANGEEIIANIGRFGPYIKVGSNFISIKDNDPKTISEAEARIVIAEKSKEIASRVIADYGQIKVLRGQYGPYVTNGKLNAKIPKNLKPEEIDESEAKKIILARKKK
jgi:DNA topoisomerase-1